jgi:hypothetical protein
MGQLPAPRLFPLLLHFPSFEISMVYLVIVLLLALSGRI